MVNHRKLARAERNQHVGLFQRKLPLVPRLGWLCSAVKAEASGSIVELDVKISVHWRSMNNSDFAV